MVKKLRGLAPLLVIVIGLLVLFYPTISNFLVMKNASRVVSNYDAAVEALSDEEYRSMIDAAHAYNTRLAEESSGTTSALTGAVNTEATDAEYMKLLNLAGDGMMGYITVPKLKETLPIYHGTSEKVLQSGIGHLEQTSLPVGGASTHAALSGHRGLPTAKLFTDLNLMKKGDKFYITILKDTYAYQVDKITTVLPTDAKQLAIEPGKDLVTLITCTPYAVNTHRLLVRGHRIPYTPQQQNDAKSTFHVDIPLQYLLPSLALIALLIAWHLWQRHERRRRQSGSAKVASGDSSSTAIEPDGDLPPQPANTNNQSHSPLLSSSLVLCLSASWCHTRKLIPSALSPSMPCGTETRLHPNHLPAIPTPSCASLPSQRTATVAFPHIKPSVIFPVSLPIGNA